MIFKSVPGPEQIHIAMFLVGDFSILYGKNLLTLWIEMMPKVSSLSSIELGIVLQYLFELSGSLIQGIIISLKGLGTSDLRPLYRTLRSLMLIVLNHMTNSYFEHCNRSIVPGEKSKISQFTYLTSSLQVILKLETKPLIFLNEYSKLSRRLIKHTSGNEENPK